MSGTVATVRLTDGGLPDLADALRTACREVAPAAVLVDVHNGVLHRPSGSVDGAAVTRIRQTLERARVPSVIAAAGPVSGAGLAALLAFDVALCDPDSEFTIDGAAAALGSGLSSALADRIGPARARGWLLAGRSLDAATARDWGLVTAAEPECGTAAATLAAGWAADPGAGLLRRSLDAATRLGPAEAREFDAELLSVLRETDPSM